MTMERTSAQIFVQVMNRLVCALFLLSFSSTVFAVNGGADVHHHRVNVVFFDAPASHLHNQQVQRIFDLKTCQDCSVKGFPIYDTSGNLQENLFLQAIAQSKQLISKNKNEYYIFHWSWNLPLTEKLRSVFESLKDLETHPCFDEHRCWWVAASGSRGWDVDKTVMGQLHRVILIGEIDDQNKIPIRDYTGDKIFAAIKRIPKYPGSSFTSAAFTGLMARFLVNHTGHQLKTRLSLNSNALVRSIKIFKNKKDLNGFFE